MVNLDKPILQMNTYDYFLYSPTNIKKNILIHPNLIRDNNKPKKSEYLFEKLDKLEKPDKKPSRQELTFDFNNNINTSSGGNSKKNYSIFDRYKSRGQEERKSLFS